MEYIEYIENIWQFSGVRGERPLWPPPTWPSFENLPRSRGENTSTYLF